jgi:hypothetical protein
LQEGRKSANNDAGMSVAKSVYCSRCLGGWSMATTIQPPEQIRLEASSFCNLRCPTCPTTKGDIHRQAVGGGFLRFDDFRKLLNDNPGLKRIELSNWGEIFLNPALLSVLELAHARGVELC